MKTNTHTDAKDNRTRLLNMTAGGDGNISAWIEKVTYDNAPADAQQYGYIVHMPQSVQQDGKAAPAIHVHVDSEAAARGLLHATETGAKPRNPEDKAEDVAALLNSIPITDNGRHIPYGSK